MHANHQLLDRLFSALDAHDHETMAACYAPNAHFRDIAFDLDGRDQIRSMWRMICSGDIQTTFEVVQADEDCGLVQVADTYTFGASKEPPSPGRPVRNKIQSRFTFQDGLISTQVDECDARAWARDALGDGIAGFLAGRLRWIRSRKASEKLAAFVEAHPE